MSKDIGNFKTLNEQTLIDMLGTDEETINELKSDYKEQMKSSASQLLESTKNSDYSAIKQQAHFFKTSSVAIGAEKTGAILQQLEHAALDQDYAEVLRLMSLLKDELTSLNKEIANE